MCESLHGFIRWRVRHLLRAFPRRPTRKNLPGAGPRRVLCLVCGGLGDRLMSLPALRLLRSHYPRALFSVVWMWGDLPRCAGEWDHSFSNALAHPLRLFSHAARGWDLVFVNALGVFSVRAEICVRLARPLLAIGPQGRDGPAIAGLYNQTYPVDTPGHLSGLTLRGIASHAPADPAAYPLPRCGPPPPATLVRIAFHPGSRHGYEQKRWPWRRFTETAERCMARGAEVIFILGPDDPEGKLPATIRVARPRSLEALCCLLERCHGLVANDSGPAHLAAALGVPVTVLFGPTDPSRVAPVGPAVTVIQADRPCAPCFSRKPTCTTPKNCMEAIPVARVVASLKENGILPAL